MLDIKFVRENPEIVKQNIRNKFQDNKLELVDKVIELDKENREIKQEVEALRAERNKTSKQIVFYFSLNCGILYEDFLDDKLKDEEKIVFKKYSSRNINE